jgi:hypothetical protein
MRNGGATLFVQAKLAEEFGLGGRGIGRLAQTGEQTFTKGH